MGNRLVDAPFERTPQTIAQAVLDEFKIKHPKMLEELVLYIKETGRVPEIKIKWNSAKEDIVFEVVG